MKIKDLLQSNQDINQNIKKELLSSLLSMTKSELILNLDQDLSTKKLITYKKYIKKIKKGIPYQYVLNQSFFYNNSFYVNQNVLIPRPETEVLVEELSKYIKTVFNSPVNILDIGTGSGNIAITLKKINENYQITASDISNKALKVAKKNAKSNNTKIKFIKSDLFKKIKGQFQVIVSNPPYIPYKSKYVEEIVKNNEPHQALYAKNDGLYFYQEIIKNAKEYLTPKNIIAFETGENEHQAIIKLAKKNYPNAKIYSKKDYNNFERYIFIIND